MTKKDRKQTLKLIDAGIKAFPKVLAQKKLAFKHKQKMMKAFAPISKALQKAEKNKTLKNK